MVSEYASIPYTNNLTTILSKKTNGGVLELLYLINSFWEDIILARDLEVLKSIYLSRLTFQTNTVRHQNITKLKCQDVKLDQLSRCQNEKVRVKTATKK